MQSRQAIGRAVGCQSLHDIFNHHHGGIHQHADGNGQTAQAHQVSRQAKDPHKNKGAECRKRQYQRNRQCRAHIAEKQAEQHNHQ